MSRFYSISPLILQTCIRPFTRLFLWVFGDLKVFGLEKIENISLKNGVIFAVNHPSELDPILIPSSLPFLSRFMPLYYTTREKKFYDDMGAFKKFMYGGTFFKLWGGHPVGVGMQDYEKSLKTHIEILLKGKNVLIFPEGGISQTGEMGPAKGGTAYLALRCKTPVIPVAISGTRGFTPASFFRRKYKIRVRFLNPIYPDKLVVIAKEDGSINYAATAQIILDEIGKNVF